VPHSYTLKRIGSYAKANGERSIVMIWSGTCAECGRSITQATGPRPPRLFKRACETCCNLAVTGEKAKVDKFEAAAKLDAIERAVGGFEGIWTDPKSLYEGTTELLDT
jgi:hypothetical protein